MELLKEFHDKDVGVEEQKGVKYISRKATRAVVFNEEGKIALLFVSKNNFHKIPGGGIDEGEDIKNALAREVMEEVGCTIDINGEVGIIVEYRSKFEQVQTSYCFLAKVNENKEKCSFTDWELSYEFKLKWVDLDEAIKLIENDKPTSYAGRFIVRRDLLFLKKAKGLKKD